MQQRPATASPSAAGARPVRRPACRPAFSTSAGATARTLIRASVPERVAMRLTGHTSRAIVDRDHSIHEQERLDAGDQLVAYLAQQARAPDRCRRPAPPSRATHHRLRAGPRVAHPTA